MTLNEARAAAPLMAHGGQFERLQVWRCMGCGRIEAPQPCIGVCQDRTIEVVPASEYDEVLDQLNVSRKNAGAAMALLRRLAWTTPRQGEWEHSYRALQQHARELLAEPARDAVVALMPQVD